MNVELPETLAIIESIVYKSKGFAIEGQETSSRPFYYQPPPILPVSISALIWLSLSLQQLTKSPVFSSNITFKAVCGSK